MRAPVKQAIIERRKTALFKKAEELFVLCGSEIGIVISSPTEGGPVVCWPEVEVAKKRFLAFMNVPAEERAKKMVLHEECMRDRVNEEIGKMRKKEDEVERKEMNFLIKEVIGGKKRLREMDIRQLKGLYDLAGEKMKELEKRKQDLENDGGGETNQRAASPDAAAAGAAISGGGESFYVPQPPAPLVDAWCSGGVPPPGPATWIIPTMAAPPPPGGGGEGSYQQMLFSAAAAAAGSLPTNNGGGNSVAASSTTNFDHHHQLPSLNQTWPYNYFSSST